MLTKLLKTSRLFITSHIMIFSHITMQTFLLSLSLIIPPSAAFMPPFETTLLLPTIIGQYHLCSGAILNRETVLTYADCFSGPEPWIGVLDSSGERHVVKATKQYPLCNSSTRKYNIGMVKIEKHFNLSKTGNQEAKLSATRPAVGDVVNGVMGDMLAQSMKGIPSSTCEAQGEEFIPGVDQVCVSTLSVVEGSYDSRPLVNVRKEVIGLMGYSSGCIVACVYTIVGPYLE